MGFDIIGDVHGEYVALLNLFNKLGYRMVDGIYQHPDFRIPIFVGDIIDKGPNIRETLQLVKAMVDKKKAICIMGNHEYNAINFWELDRTNKMCGYYRSHTHKNILQHLKTITDFVGRSEEWEEYRQWMTSMPPILEMPQFRVVHACFHPSINEFYKQAKKEAEVSTPGQLMISVSRQKVSWTIDNTPVHKILETTLKGSKIKLPDGITINDKYGEPRDKYRPRWWINPQKATHSQYMGNENYEKLSSKDMVTMEKMPIDLSKIDPVFWNGYGEDEKPIFVGHYDLSSANPIQANNVCCLDHKGKLTAYRYDNESILTPDKLVSVSII